MASLHGHYPASPDRYTLSPSCPVERPETLWSHMGVLRMAASDQSGRGGDPTIQVLLAILTLGGASAETGCPRVETRKSFSSDPC